ncbi:hypothetical protein BDY21DRAFT_343443 [Lineolata rhizophorae]|uniref:Uncharacterized protein n=1 Tax=Lineolata rhizophorae TaxID=578093 RepID=A0A6A6P2S7_9PEZI|nr:hypothetical protein BDY21DRAFT_343443 [Lineolata rhizophorae]
MALDDIWAVQLPPENVTAAKIKDRMREGLRQETRQEKWAEVKYRYVNGPDEDVSTVRRSEGSEAEKGCGRRAMFAAARGTEVDGASVVVWGGVDARGKVADDGWMVTVSN